MTGRFNSLRRLKLERYWRFMPEAGGRIPDGPISDTLFVTLMARVARHAPAAIGLRVGAERRIADLGLLGHVTMSCANLAEVADIWRLYADDAGELVAITSAMDSDSGLWTIRFDPMPIIAGAISAILVDELCASFFRYAEELTGEAFAEFTVHLPHPPIQDVRYASYFPGEVRFRSSFAGLTGPADAFSQPILYRNPEALALLTQRFALDGGAKSGTLELSLADHFLRRRGKPSAKAAAAALGLSERTLRRRLAGRGASYGALLEAFRCELGCALLHERTLRPKQIAPILGYEDENSLRRAFRKWRGQSISAWLNDQQ